MSGAPKRGPHEEGRHLSASSCRPEEETHAYPRVGYTYGPAPGTRPGILPRPDSRDGERRTALPPSPYIIPSVMADSHSSHSSHPVAAPEVRPESGETKGSRGNKAAESNWEVKLEPREAHNQSGKADKEGRVESRFDDGKEVKHERERGNDQKSEVKAEKDGYVLGASCPSWIEQHRGKRNPDVPGGGGLAGAWKESQYETKYEAAKEITGRRHPDVLGGAGLLPQYRAKYEAPKEVVMGAILKDRVEGNDAVGENRADSKADDKHKDRKRKDVKHYDYPETDKDRSVHRSDLQAGSSSNNDAKEATREARESEQLEIEKKDLHKERERHKEREKDQADKEGRSGAEKEGCHDEKNVADRPSFVINHSDSEKRRELPKDQADKGRSGAEKEGSHKEKNVADRPSFLINYSDLEKRRELLKERERQKETEKDQADKGGRNGAEKEGYHNEKNVADKPAFEIYRSNFERAAKERRKERDGDVEGERPEKRRCYEKEPDEGAADADGGTDKERDAFGYGIQQKRRMLRPRGSPLVANRDAHFTSPGQDAEGSQGKPEVSTVYKVGECLQELTRLWMDYQSSHSDKSSDNLYNGPTLEIRIPAEHVTATNRQVRGGQLWGTDIYTNDSDLVAVLMHTGYCRPTSSPPPAAIQELSATIRVLPPQESYVSTLRNNVRSRAWGAAIGCSYRVECCCIMKKGGGTIDLEPCLTHTSAIEPTLAPVAVERSMTTRAAASNALRQQRFVREVTIQYNLCNEPWIKYSISVVADKGLKKPLFTSARLKKGEVLYLETHACRYELCFIGEKIIKTPSLMQLHEAEAEKSQNHASSVNGDRSMTDADNSHSMVVDMFRWSRCKKPLPQKVMRSIGIPLPLDHVEVLEENLDWEDVQWSQTGVWIGGKEYPLSRVHFLSPN